MLGEPHRARGRAPRGRGGAAAAATVSRERVVGTHRRESEVQRAQLRHRRPRPPTRGAARAARRGRERFLAGAASSGCDARTRSPSTSSSPASTASSTAPGSADRGKLGRARVAAQRDREQQPAHRARQPRHARAEHVLDRVGHRYVLADLGHARARPARARSRARTAGCPTSTRRCAAAAAATGSGRAARTASGASRRGSAGRPRRRSRPPLSSARSRTDGRPGRLASRNATGSRLDAGARQRPARRPTANRATGRRRSPPAAARRRPARAAAFRNPSAIACGGGGTPVGWARSSATSNAATLRRRHRQRSRIDPVEQIDQRRERQLRLGTARPRDEHTPPALPPESDPGLPQRGLADTRPAYECERSRGRIGPEELAQHRVLRLAPDDPRDPLTPRLHLSTLADPEPAAEPTSRAAHRNPRRHAPLLH